MKEMLHSTKPTGDSELDFLLTEIWEAIQVKMRILNRPGVITVEYTEKGIALTPVAGGKSSQSSNPFTISQSTDWLTYKVSDGIAITTGDPISVANVDTDIAISAGVLHYWIYLEMTATTAEVKASSTTLEWSTLLIPIGWVDTATNEVGEVATIYQVLRDNIFNPCAT
jgi:hypothetical protein